MYQNTTLTFNHQYFSSHKWVHGFGHMDTLLTLIWIQDADFTKEDMGYISSSSNLMKPLFQVHGLRKVYKYVFLKWSKSCGLKSAMWHVLEHLHKLSVPITISNIETSLITISSNTLSKNAECFIYKCQFLAVAKSREKPCFDVVWCTVR